MGADREEVHGAFEYAIKELGLAPPPYRSGTEPFVTAARLIGVVDQVPVEVRAMSRGETLRGDHFGTRARQMGLQVTVTVTGLPKGLRIRSRMGRWGWRWRRVECRTHHKAVRAADMSILATYLTPERINALCPYSFTLKKGSITHSRPLGRDPAAAVSTVRDAVQIAHALTANYG